jgi:hypothetical protein
VAQECRDLAGELLVWQQQVKDAAAAAVSAHTAENADAPMSQHMAWLVRDACMLNLLFGHSSLAQRGSLVCSIKASAHAHMPCMVPNCPMAAFEPLAGSSAAHVCYGNRFVWSAEGTLQIVAPHHKGSGIGVLLISDVTEKGLLGSYEMFCRAALNGCDEDAQQMFFDDRGRPFNTGTLNSWWENTLE